MHSIKSCSFVDLLILKVVNGSRIGLVGGGKWGCGWKWHSPLTSIYECKSPLELYGGGIEMQVEFRGIFQTNDSG